MIKKTQGFTLIELVIVIVILGILATTAAPKFININSDARISALHAMGGAINDASQLAYAKALLQGLTQAPSAIVDFNGDGNPDINTQYGYPSGSRGNGLSKVMAESFATDWIWSTDYRETKFYLTLSDLLWTSGQYVNQDPIVATNCYMIYTPAATVGETPTIEYITTGC
jgi:MSHA pilin protein MshA